MTAPKSKIAELPQGFTAACIKKTIEGWQWLRGAPSESEAKSAAREQLLTILRSFDETPQETDRLRKPQSQLALAALYWHPFEQDQIIAIRKELDHSEEDVAEAHGILFEETLISDSLLQKVSCAVKGSQPEQAQGYYSEQLKKNIPEERLKGDSVAFQDDKTLELATDILSRLNRKTRNDCLASIANLILELSGFNLTEAGLSDLLEKELLPTNMTLGESETSTRGSSPTDSASTEYGIDSHAKPEDDYPYKSDDHSDSDSDSDGHSTVSDSEYEVEETAESYDRVISSFLRVVSSDNADMSQEGQRQNTNHHWQPVVSISKQNETPKQIKGYEQTRSKKGVNRKKSAGQAVQGKTTRQTQSNAPKATASKSEAVDRHEWKEFKLKPMKTPKNKLMRKKTTHRTQQGEATEIMEKARLKRLEQKWRPAGVARTCQSTKEKHSLFSTAKNYLKIKPRARLAKPKSSANGKPIWKP